MAKQETLVDVVMRQMAEDRHRKDVLRSTGKWAEHHLGQKPRLSRDEVPQVNTRSTFALLGLELGLRKQSRHS